jgi:RNA polymerase sigma-70 factor (ECF subfamily)
MDVASAAARARRFEEQILPHLPDLYRAARRLVRRTDEAEDLVQETCLRAFGALDQLRHPEAAKAWVFTVLRSVFLRDVARWEAARAASADVPASDVGEGPMGTSTADSPWHGALIEEARLATQRLPIAFREVVILAHVAGFSYREMAGILGIPVGTVMSRLFRARRLLRAALGVGVDEPHRSETHQ